MPIPAIRQPVIDSGLPASQNPSTQPVPSKPRLRLWRPESSPETNSSLLENSELDDRHGIGLRRPWMTWSYLIASLIAGITITTLAGCHWASASQNSQGAAMYNQGQYTGAMEQFQKAIASNPKDPDGYYNLAATTHRLGNQRQDPNLIRQSEALYNQCLDHDPNHVDCHRGLAVLLVDSGRPDRAFTLLKNWAAQNPTLAEPRIELARLYEEHGEPQTALKYLEDAVQTDANNPRAWLALARLRESSGDPVQALQNYQRVLALGGGVGGSSALATERVAALSRQINSANDARLNSGGTQIASPAFGSTRY
ncbi:tetratricopeptide repeat protein [Rhodopirellula sallentina]|uniref:TPR repeat containing protein n=1 Tax=Rhodopirellula sallentina SM41 TaxID=1263870 RepID=M5U7X7_9BACT|nr:tetratricopeptide repeat protein [Rhodopirellula sallentina]EMI52058.1 TPR repeat containing protein [Rhodopirellula sallentina SM41]